MKGQLRAPDLLSLRLTSLLLYDWRTLQKEDSLLAAPSGGGCPPSAALPEGRITRFPKLERDPSLNMEQPARGAAVAYTDLVSLLCPSGLEWSCASQDERKGPLFWWKELQHNGYTVSFHASSMPLLMFPAGIQSAILAAAGASCHCLSVCFSTNQLPQHEDGIIIRGREWLEYHRRRWLPHLSVCLGLPLIVYTFTWEYVLGRSFGCTPKQAGLKRTPDRLAFPHSIC